VVLNYAYRGPISKGLNIEHELLSVVDFFQALSRLLEKTHSKDRW